MKAVGSDPLVRDVGLRGVGSALALTCMAVFTCWDRDKKLEGLGGAGFKANPLRWHEHKLYLHIERNHLERKLFLLHPGRLGEGRVSRKLLLFVCAGTAIAPRANIVHATSSPNGSLSTVRGGKVSRFCFEVPSHVRSHPHK